MESGSSYQFPEFEGKYASFSEKEVVFCTRLPNHPSIEKVYILYSTEAEDVKADGWTWGPANKSSKSFFGNIKGVQKAMKYKCTADNCQSVKYVDSCIAFDVSRIYYENHHKHEKLIQTEGRNVEDRTNKGPFDSDSEDDHNVFKKPENKLKRKRRNKKIYSKLIIDNSEDEEDYFIPNITSTPDVSTTTARKMQPKKKTAHGGEIDGKVFKKVNSEASNSENSNGDFERKEELKASEESIHNILSETEEIMTKIKLNRAHLIMLKNNKQVLSHELLNQMKRVQRLKSENVVLQNSLNLEEKEIKTLEDKNANLKQLLSERDKEKQIVTLDEQIKIIESLIADKISRKEDEHEVQILQQSLNICSAKKIEVLAKTTPQTINDEREQVKRNLFNPVKDNLNRRLSHVLCNSESLNDEVVSTSHDPPTPCPAHLLRQETDVNKVKGSGGQVAKSHMRPSVQAGDPLHSPDPLFTSVSFPSKSVRCREMAPQVQNNNHLEQGYGGDSEIGEVEQNDLGILQEVCQVTDVNEVQVHDKSIDVEVCEDQLEDLRKGEDATLKSFNCNNDTLIQTPSTVINNHHDDLDSSITFLNINQDVNLERYEEIINMQSERKSGKNYGLAFKVSDPYWDDCETIEGPVPHGQNGKSVYEIPFNESVKSMKISDVEDMNDGRNWSKKKMAVKSFEGCTDHKRYYQDCNGLFECSNLNCSARKLFATPTQTYAGAKSDGKVENRCSSCDQVMSYIQCLDETLHDKNGCSPKSRRYLDFDFCHKRILVKYVGTHTCKISRKVLPMNTDFVLKYFKANPGSSASNFKDFAISHAISEDKNIEEVSLQYADLTKIKQILIKSKKIINPDGSGSAFLKGFGESLKEKLGDPYLLNVSENPFMIIVSSKERIKVAEIMSDKTYNTNESVSIDFCESQFKDYSVMEVTTYSGELKQLVPIFQAVVKKPGENGDNVFLALSKFDEMMLEHSGKKFEPLQWTTDNSGALERGIIRAKGAQAKSFLASDKLHDHNNIQRVLRTVPKHLQDKLKTEIFKMINGAVPQVSENIYQCLINKAKTLTDQKLFRSLVFNYRKRHKIWYAYRDVLDNNATSEQVNRVMTRHGKNEGLIAGVQRMVRMSIADKAKFQLAEDGVMLNRGPSVKARKVRVEKSLIKSLPEIVSSIEEEANSQESPVDKDLKDKALEDFMPKPSDTHRSDKKRKNVKSAEGVKKTKVKVKYLKVKKSLHFMKLNILKFEISEQDVTVTFKNGLGLENTVNITSGCVLCTCSDHNSNYFCPEIVKLFELLKLEELSQKKTFTSKEFGDIRRQAKLLKVTTEKIIVWTLVRTQKKVIKCTSCKENIKPNQVGGKYLRKIFHPTRICLPREVIDIKAKIETQLTEGEEQNLVINGVQF